MSNPLIDIMKEGNERQWCMRYHCTTCGAREYREKLKELGGPLGGPLADALSQIDIQELVAIPDWENGLLIAITDLPMMSMHVEKMLKAWIPQIPGNIYFADHILFYLVKYLPGGSRIKTDWINSSIAAAVETKDSSLTESLLFVLGNQAEDHSELITIAKEVAGYSPKVKRALRKKCNIYV